MFASYLRHFLASFLFVGLGLGAHAQSSFKFDGFSYSEDVLFGLPTQTFSPAPTHSINVNTQMGDVLDAMPVRALNEAAQENKIYMSKQDQFTAQLAIDKALSRILKLTVDYETLKIKVERSGVGSKQSNPKSSKSWFSFGGDDEDEDNLEDLMALSRKQINERDQQIEVIQTRLEAVQTRYDNENVSRLLAEKRLKIMKDQQKKYQLKATKTSDKVNFLAGQLEKNQKTIRQLKIDITKEKLKTFQLGQSEVSVAKVSVTKADVVKVSETATKFNSDLNTLFSGAEWLIQGLAFEEASAEIKQSSAANVKVLAAYLQNNPKVSVQINGYTDSVGSAISNQALSLTRAQSVQAYLESQGIAFHRIKAVGYGERSPIASNASAQGRAENRRVAVLIFQP
ncbi:MAG: OmpA family protein [Arenicellales bacterium]